MQSSTHNCSLAGITNYSISNHSISNYSISSYSITNYSASNHGNSNYSISNFSSPTLVSATMLSATIASATVGISTLDGLAHIRAPNIAIHCTFCALLNAQYNTCTMEPSILLMAQMPSSAPPLPYLTVLTLQRSLLGPHWAMHEPSGPLSVLHRVKHAQNPLLFLLLLVVPVSRELGGGCFFVCLCKPLSGILVAEFLRQYGGGKMGHCSHICQ